MSPRFWLLFSFVTFVSAVTVLLPVTGGPVFAQENGLKDLEGEWLFVEDQTEGRAVKDQGPPMSVKFSLRVEEDAVVYPRPRGDERITLDGSNIEKKNNNGSFSRYRGEWKNGSLIYTMETIRESDNKRVLMIQRVFRATKAGLLVQVSLNEGTKQVALYRHPEEIALPKPAKATISDIAWLADVWVSKKRTSSTEERWSPPKGGAMLGTSQTIRTGKMVAFEYLRIVERDGGLVYVAQPGGRSPTEFVLTQLTGKRAVFVNPRHDYPQRIIYELSKDDALTASIGFAKGRLQSFEFSREK